MNLSTPHQWVEGKLSVQLIVWILDECRNSQTNSILKKTSWLSFHFRCLFSFVVSFNFLLFFFSILFTPIKKKWKKLNFFCYFFLILDIIYLLRIWKQKGKYQKVKQKTKIQKKSTTVVCTYNTLLRKTFTSQG
jgi:hypothetical protein